MVLTLSLFFTCATAGRACNNGASNCLACVCNEWDDTAVCCTGEFNGSNGNCEGILKGKNGPFKKCCGGKRGFGRCCNVTVESVTAFATFTVHLFEIIPNGPHLAPIGLKDLATFLSNLTVHIFLANATKSTDFSYPSAACGSRVNWNANANPAVAGSSG
ncbi:hypothetical protein Fcan01_16483 [Folsomia candida]|uniref:Uncharacterized protein n=1 Tax=Folsomia candida TaxID=158441 RepID=A0A226DWK4_FOLCA|nr:hypothetical protein Fcan01_16483 [Folsomia candida]